MTLQTQFTFDSGARCLDFLATLSDRDGEAIERLVTPLHLGAWFAEAGMLDVASTCGEDDLEAAYALRECLFSLVQSARSAAPPERSSISLINEWAERPVLVPQLAADGSTRSWIGAAPGTACLAALARETIVLIGGKDLQRVRQCEGRACSMLFLDTSRAGNRRWCSMSRCGNRSKKQAFRQRNRPDE